MDLKNENGDVGRATYSHLVDKHQGMDPHICYSHTLWFDRIRNFVHILVDIQYTDLHNILVNMHMSQHHYVLYKRHLLRMVNLRMDLVYPSLVALNIHIYRFKIHFLLLLLLYF